jgi:hypothetical protein
MSVPPCICTDPNGPSGCTCSRSQVPRQWLGHPYPGPSALFANPSTSAPAPFTFSQFPSTNFHHAPHELNEFHDPRNVHGTQGYTSIQHSLFLPTPYNNPHPPNPTSQFHHYQPPPNAALPATQGNPSPLNRRKCKNNATGQGGAARKRQRQCASTTAAPTSAICGVGPSTTVLPSSPPSSSPQLPTINVQPPSDSMPTSSTSTQLPSASYSSLRANRKPQERSSAATDIWYFCRSSESELKPANLPSPDQEVTLKRKPRSPFVSCKLCKYVSLFYIYRYGSHIMHVGNGRCIEIRMVLRQRCETISNYGTTRSTRG